VSGVLRPPIPPGPYLVIGLARSGQAAVKALLARGEHVIGVDRGRPDGVDELTGADLRLGSDGQEAVESVSVVVCSPGVPASAPALVAARRAELPVLGELELAWRLVDVPLLAITGTNGKTTTTELVAHVLRSAGRDAAVVGNVGTAFSSLALPGAPRPDIVVCEVSSFQLEVADEFLPETAVLLNLASDHLDRHGSLRDYHAAKLSIFARQRPEHLAVLPDSLEAVEVPGRARRLCFGPRDGSALQIKSDALLWQGEHLIARQQIRIPGPQNAENAAAAASATLSLGVPEDAVRSALQTFEGVPHRLQTVHESDGVLWVNDSKATNVAAAVVALRSFGERAIHVILGGTGKGEDYGPLREPLAAYASHAYLIGEEAAAIGAAIDDVVATTVVGQLDRAVSEARRAARPGDVVLLAPACASYDQFRDFEQRGQVFTELARSSD